MEVNELRIGNYVNIEGDVVKVKEIYEKSIHYTYGEYESYATEDFIQPIKLTEELLLNIGFKKNKYDWWKYFPDRENEISILMSGEYTTIEYANLFHCPEDVTEVNYGSKLEFPRRIYLHELQNAYFLISNQEMEIEL